MDRANGFRRRLEVSSGLVLTTWLSWAVAAHASGTLPEMQMPPQDFASFAACLTSLEDIAKEAATKATPAQPDANGGTFQTEVNTKGVIQQGGNHAVYDVEFGFIGRSDPHKDPITTQYSWERYHYACEGARQTSTDQRGYSEPLIEKGPDTSPAAH